MSENSTPNPVHRSATISYGRRIKSSADPLSRFSLFDLAQMVGDRSSDLYRLISQMRVARTLDVAQYSRMKTDLPYIVCAAFSPDFRKKDNFAFAECFAIDVDHIAEKGLSLSDVRTKIQADPRVALSFVSPSGDGLKVFFLLAERCYDANLYTVFYKAFAADFSNQYGLNQVVDTCTCDVSRACFLSHDGSVYLNQHATPVRMADFVSTDSSLNFFDAQQDRPKENKDQPQEKPKDQQVEQPTSEPQTQQPAPAKSSPTSADPDAIALAQIKERLQSNRRPRPEKIVPNVPQELKDSMPDFRTNIEQTYGIDVYEVKDIQYGQKIRARLGKLEAELNVYCGKHGITIVESPRTGTNPDLNAAFHEMADDYFFS